MDPRVAQALALVDAASTLLMEAGELDASHALEEWLYNGAPGTR